MVDWLKHCLEFRGRSGSCHSPSVTAHMESRKVRTQGLRPAGRVAEVLTPQVRGRAQPRDLA
jgi:hypothetical protein